MVSVLAMLFEKLNLFQVAYEMLTQRIGEKVADGEAAVKLVEDRYNGVGGEKQTDEFLKPIIIGPDHEEGTLRDGDTMILFNYRADRMREIAEAVGIKPPFETSRIPKDFALYCMTQYNAAFPMPLLFPPQVEQFASSQILPVEMIVDCSPFWLFSGSCQRVSRSNWRSECVSNAYSRD